MRICYLVTVSSVYSESSNTTEIHLKMLTQARISTKDSCFVLPKHRFLADVCGWLIPKVAEVGIDLLRIRRIRVYLSGTVGKEWILLERLERMLTQLNKHQFCQKVKKKKSLYLKTFISRLKTKTKNFLMAKTALHIEWYFGTEPPLKVFFVWSRIGKVCHTLKKV